MKKAFYSSLSIHLLVFILISVTLPEIKTKEIDYIAIEIINEEIKENKSTIEKKEIKTLKQAKVEKKVKLKPKPPKQKPEIKKENIEPKKVALKPQPPQKKPIFKTKENKDVDTKNNDQDEVFDDMLKNLAKIEEQPIKPKKKIINKPKTENKRSKGELKNIQNSIISKIYKQIKENYTLPPAPDLKVLDDITVQLRIYVGPDGTINKTVVKKKSLSKAKNDPTYLPYVEAAQRAIKRLGKFSKLPEEEYNIWKIIDISFTPYQT